MTLDRFLRIFEAQLWSHLQTNWSLMSISCTHGTKIDSLPLLDHPTANLAASFLTTCRRKTSWLLIDRNRVVSHFPGVNMWLLVGNYIYFKLIVTGWCLRIYFLADPSSTILLVVYITRISWRMMMFVELYRFWQGYCHFCQRRYLLSGQSLLTYFRVRLVPFQTRMWEEPAVESGIVAFSGNF